MDAAVGVERSRPALSDSASASSSVGAATLPLSTPQQLPPQQRDPAPQPSAEEAAEEDVSSGSRAPAPPRLADRLGELRHCRAQGLLSDEEHDALRGNELDKFREYGSAKPFEVKDSNSRTIVQGFSQLVPLLKGLMQALDKNGKSSPYTLAHTGAGSSASHSADAASEAKAQPAARRPVAGPRPPRRIRGKQPYSAVFGQRGAAGQRRLPSTPIPQGPGAKRQQEAECQGHYDELRLPRSASAYEVRAAYRQRCLETHPDKISGDSAPFVRVNKAFTVLSDREQRAQYDSELQADGNLDGLKEVDSSWAVQHLERESDRPEKARLRAARAVHMALSTRPKSEWQKVLSSADEETLEAMIEWQKTPAVLARGRKLAPVLAPCISLSSHGTRYDVRIQFDYYILIANSTADLGVAVDRCVALTRIREIWVEKRPTCLTLDDFMCAIHFEPSINIKVIFRKVMQGRRIQSPILMNLRRGLQVHDILAKASSGPGAVARIEKLLKEVRAQTEVDRRESEELENRILQAAQKELDSRRPPETPLDSGRPPRASPSPTRDSRTFLAGCGNGALPPSGLPLPLPAMTDISGDEAVLGCRVTVSIFGLPADTGDRLLGLLQLRTFCRLQLVSRSLASAVASRGRQRVSNYVYTADSLESVVYSTRGRRMIPKSTEAKTRLVRFLSQPEHGPVFRHLDLHQAPVDALQDPQLHTAFRHMTRLTRLIYPTVGWSNVRLKQAFLASVPPTSIKEPVMPLGRT